MVRHIGSSADARLPEELELVGASRSGMLAWARELGRQRCGLIGLLLAEGFSQAGLSGETVVTCQAIQMMAAAGQEGPQR
jgi:hypothetical protein